MAKFRIRSAAATHMRWSAAAIEVAPGTYRYPRGSLARTLAGTAIDLDRAAFLRRQGLKQLAEDALKFCRDARIFAPESKLPG